MSSKPSTAPEPPPDHHAPMAVARLHPTSGHGDGGGAALAYPADLIETTCPACMLEFRDGRFRHDRGCPMRVKAGR
jgi:hypothetical protein